MGKLVANVHVDGAGWFGPDYGNADDVPADVASGIVNPDAWEDGKLPKGVKAPETPVDDSTPVEPATDGGDDDLDVLRAEYRTAAGKDADKRWGADRLRDEITAASEEG